MRVAKKGTGQIEDIAGHRIPPIFYPIIEKLDKIHNIRSVYSYRIVYLSTTYKIQYYPLLFGQRLDAHNIISFAHLPPTLIFPEASDKKYGYSA